MKRTKKTVEKRTYTLKNAFPRFVSIVTRGANFTPFSELKFSDGASMADVEINRIEFAKTNFPTKDSVEQYLQSNGFEQYTIDEDKLTFIVPGVEADKFSEETIAPIDYEDGIKHFIGKLKQPVSDEPVGDVIDSEVIDQFTQPEAEENVKEEEVQESQPEGSSTPEGSAEAQEEEVVAEGDLDPAGVPSNPPDDLSAPSDADMHVEPAGTENEDSTDDIVGNLGAVAGLLKDIESQMEALAAKLATLKLPIIGDQFSQEQVDELLTAKEAEIRAEFAEQNEVFEQKNEKPIDEDSLIIQNRQGIQPEQINDEAPVVDAAVAKFEQKKLNNIFGY
jgi:hypothetical protein